MGNRVVLLGLVAASALWGQGVCPATPTYSPCDLTFEMTAEEAAQHKNPYMTVTLHAELMTPRHRTFAMPGFWDGGRKFVIRVAPTDVGQWTFRVTSNLASLNGKTGSFTATESNHPGFIKPDNFRAWSTTETRKAHLWMGDTLYPMGTVDRGTFDRLIAARAAQHFTHVRGLVLAQGAYRTPDEPNVEYFQELDRRIRAMNEKGIFADLILAGPNGHLVQVLPQREQRERFLRYLIARYSPMMITWQGVQQFETYPEGRALVKEIGLYLKERDPHGQPRSTDTVATSASLLGDGWMTHIIYRTSAVPLAAVERQLYAVPAVNVDFGAEDSGGGKARAQDVDSEEFHKRLWRMTMNGAYPTFANTGTSGDGGKPVDAKYAESPGAKAMKAWFELFERTRYWELEPDFEVNGGVALALGGIEYIVYVEKPGAFDIVTERKGYEVYWLRPGTGEITKEKKDYKAEKWEGETPDKQSDWVLHLSRDGRKEGMAKSWKFESRPMYQQEPERTPAKIPFELQEPSAETLPVGKPLKFAAKLTRETRASKVMQYVWTAESTSDGQGYRVLGTTQSGEFTIPKNIALKYPTVLNVRLYGINGNGKVYQIDRVYKAGE